MQQPLDTTYQRQISKLLKVQISAAELAAARTASRFPYQGITLGSGKYLEIV